MPNKVILCGYSEGAKLASHLSLIHPEIVSRVIAGGTGGAISMPVSNLEGYDPILPTGISDLPNFNSKAYKEISFFYYIGNADKSDSAIPYLKMLITFLIIQ